MKPRLTWPKIPLDCDKLLVKNQIDYILLQLLLFPLHFLPEFNG